MANDKPVDMIIRPVHLDDAAQLHAMVSHPSVARTLIQLPSMELSETLEWLNSRVPGRHRLVAESNDDLLGSGTLNRYRRARLDHGASLGLMVHPSHWGQGVGSALLTALMELADNWLNLKRVELGVHTDNAAAIYLYERFDFQIEGRRRMAIIRDGRWQDEFLMARIRNRPQLAVPDEPSEQPRDQRRRINDDEITIRPIERGDTSQLLSLWRHPAVAKNTLQMPSMEYAEAEERVGRRVDGLHRLVACSDGGVLGSIGLSQVQNPRMTHIGQLGMMVHPDQWGRGIGSRLMRVALDIADNWLNLLRVELEVFTDNPAAIHLYQKHGFHIEGTKRLHAFGGGRWADTHFMARIREPEG